MSEQNDAQDRTHPATPKRLKELKEKGQVVRSKELNTNVILVGSALGIMMFGPNLVETVFTIFNELFTEFSNNIFDSSTLIKYFTFALKESMLALLPILLLILVFTLLGPMLVGGWVFSFDAIFPKLERLDPIKGIQKILSIKGLLELVKALIKFAVISGFSCVLMYFLFNNFMALAYQDVYTSVVKSLEMVGYIFLAISSSLILVSSIDIPFQIMQHQKQTKMTLQEIKDEMKETEGSPEVKSQLAKVRRQLAQGRMMEAVPQADVVITNPTHYAIALKYDQASMAAPIVVAKGVDLIAQNIMKVGQTSDVPVVRVPPLARAIYYSSELQDEIPSGLYMAVAQILGYVYQLKLHQRGRAKKPLVPDNIEIPEELRR